MLGCCNGTDKGITGRSGICYGRKHAAKVFVKPLSKSSTVSQMITKDYFPYKTTLWRWYAT
jgi:hypothetical protein